MVVVVKTSMNLNQDIISAHCSFKIAETIGDCEFPALEPYILFTMRFQNLNMAPRRNFLQTSLQLCYCNRFYRRQLVICRAVHHLVAGKTAQKLH